MDVLSDTGNVSLQNASASVNNTGSSLCDLASQTGMYHFVI